VPKPESSAKSTTATAPADIKLNVNESTTEQPDQAQIRDFAADRKPTDVSTGSQSGDPRPAVTEKTRGLISHVLSFFSHAQQQQQYTSDPEYSAGSRNTTGSADSVVEASSATDKEVAHKKRVEEQQRKAGFHRRLGMALFGGLSLIVPMIIMTLNSSTEKSLITSSLFVLAFAVVMAATTAARDAEMIAGTAAYAAVLVVFVGVTIHP
jgi:hypothetical protein